VKLLIMTSDSLLESCEALRAPIRRLLQKEIYELPIQKSTRLGINRQAIEIGALDAISPTWHKFEATITDGISVIQPFPNINRFKKHAQAILSSANFGGKPPGRLASEIRNNLRPTRKDEAHREEKRAMEMAGCGKHGKP
jgi:hypothetical protein